MRLNLSIKFFAAFILISLTIVVVMAVAMQYFAYQNFLKYIHKVEEIRLNELSLLLSREYLNSNGWGRLQDNPNLWHDLMRPRGSAAYAEKLPSMPSGFESYVKPPPPKRPPPPPPREHTGEGWENVPRRDAEENTLRHDQNIMPYPDKPDDEKGQTEDDHAENREQPVFGIEHRLTLFNEQKKPVMGGAGSPAGHTLRKIVVGGRTVGWLGIRNEDKLSNPLDMDFLKQQTQAFCIVGILTLVLAAVMAFLLSRHLIMPVQQLIKGTRSLTSRKFDTRIVVNSTDELGQLAEDFNRMAQTLERYEQIRQQWISDIAHELRTPLSILQGEIEALLDGIRKADSRQLESLHTEVVYMSRIVGNLHDLSMAESDALQLKNDPVNLVQTVRKCLQKFQARFVERGIALADELGNAETVIIPGDKDRLIQVFSNLLENTLRYTDSPGCLTVRQFCTLNHVLIVFSDTQPAVPTESLDRLFDRMYCVDQSRNRAQGGSGLGLSICKTIIEAHQGAIRAQHAAAGGLQIEIMLPLLNKLGKHVRKDTDNHVP